ncbi:MAG TPA: tyrosine-protein phosphatase [Propionicimonas sp.]
MKLVTILATATLSVALVGVPVSSSVAQIPAAVPAVAAPAPTLASIWNFRDVAGAGVPLSHGATMITGVVYRSGQLKGLSNADAATLVGLGITDIYDLRSATAAKASPDPVPSGVTYHRIDVFAGHSTSYKGRTAAGARAYMRAMNRAFVTDSRQRSRIAQALRAISRADGRVLIHCAAGKDRTGWLSAMLQSIAGATRATIKGEYLLSNTYRKDLIDSKVAAARKISATRAAIVGELEVLRPSYLEAGLDKAVAKYGSLHKYWTKGLKLSATTIATLRAKLRRA